MVSPTTAMPSHHDKPASLELLPPEILLSIVTRLPGLDTLWDLLKASPHTLRLFNGHALAITEGILSGPESVLPSKTQQLVRGVVLSRSKVLPFRNLDEFHMGFMSGHVYPAAQDNLYLTLDPGCLSAIASPAATLRSVVATAHRISALSQACLASYLARLRDPSFKPLHAFNPTPYYTHGYGPDDEWVPAWDRVFVGTPVRVVDAGQPSWVEEMRVLRAMWLIQLTGDVKSLVLDMAETTGWPRGDIETLRKLDPAELADDPRNPSRKSEEVRSVMIYLKGLGDSTRKQYYQLPPPPPSTSTSARWVTSSPKRTVRTKVMLGFHFDDNKYHPFDEESSARVLPDGAKPRYTVKYNEAHYWGQTDWSLGHETGGMYIFRSFSRPSNASSPISGAKFDSFRPLGLAFWDRRRMHLLGLADGVRPPHHKEEFYWFAWESILSRQEVADLKAELRKPRLQRQLTS